MIITFSFYIFGNYSINQNKNIIPSIKNKIYIKVISPNFKLEYGLDKKEIERFLKTVQNLRKLKSGQLDRLNIIVKKSKIKRNLKKGIF